MEPSGISCSRVNEDDGSDVQPAEEEVHNRPFVASAAPAAAAVAAAVPVASIHRSRAAAAEVGPPAFSCSA